MMVEVPRFGGSGDDAQCRTCNSRFGHCEASVTQDLLQSASTSTTRPSEVDFLAGAGANKHRLGALLAGAAGPAALGNDALRTLSDERLEEGRKAFLVEPTALLLPHEDGDSEVHRSQPGSVLLPRWRRGPHLPLSSTTHSFVLSTSTGSPLEYDGSEHFLSDDPYEPSERSSEDECREPFCRSDDPPTPFRDVLSCSVDNAAGRLPSRSDGTPAIGGHSFVAEGFAFHMIGEKSEHTEDMGFGAAPSSAVDIDLLDQQLSDGRDGFFHHSSPQDGFLLPWDNVGDEEFEGQQCSAARILRGLACCEA